MEHPDRGCEVTSPGCTHCYAMRLAGTRLKHHSSRMGLTRSTSKGPVWTGEVRFNEAWLDQPLKWRRPRSIFVAAHSDLFHDHGEDRVLDKIFAVMALTRRHIYQILTKRAHRMRKYLRGLSLDRLEIAANELGYTLKAGHLGTDVWAVSLPLSNVRVGVTVEDQTRADERIPVLLDTPAATRWVSAEPLLGPIDIRIYLRKLGWVVAGGESQEGARPMHPAWVRSLRDHCAAFGVAFLFKQWGEWCPDDALTGIDHLKEVLARSRSHEWRAPSPPAIVFRVGKRMAGRRLDGVEHDGFPLRETS